MKKRILFLLVTLLCLLSSCTSLSDLFKTKVVENNGMIKLTIDEDVIPYIPYYIVPEFTLTFDGVVNTTEQRQGEFECVFTKNNDFKVSLIVKELIDKYTLENKVYIREISQDNDMETWMNDENHEKVYIKVKDGIIYNEIAYITLDNGLILSMNYARFIDQDTSAVYYRWQITESIRMVLHYPLIVVQMNGENKFLIIPLPNAVIYHFDTTTKRINDLLEKDKFQGEEYRTFAYVNSYEENYQEYVDYYINNFEGEMIDNILYIKYLNYRFSITFTESNFVINYIA